jgi:hypothetical protein
MSCGGRREGDGGAAAGPLAGARARPRQSSSPSSDPACGAQNRRAASAALPRDFFPSAGDRARPPQAGSVMRAGAKKPHQALAYPLSFFLLGLGFR